MSEKPEALRLAEALEGDYSITYQPYAAAELRLQHAENERLREIVSRWAVHHRGCGMIIGNLCNCGLDTAIDALRREDV